MAKRKFVKRGKDEFFFTPGKGGSLQKIPRAGDLRPSGFRMNSGEPRAKSIISRDLEERFRRKKGTASGRRMRFR